MAYRILAIVLGLGLLFALGCGDGDDGPDPGPGGIESIMQSSCVHGFMNLPRTVSDRGSCSNFSYDDCGLSVMASKCINYCAFDVCQAAPCTSDADCETSFGARWTCRPYVVESDDYGTWCHKPD